ATGNYRRVVELIRAGAVGGVSEAHIWVGRAWGRQSPEDAKKHDIVSARERPFHSVYVPGPKWYRWWDFGGGTMSDLGAHWLDLPFWALALDAPFAVEGSGPRPHAELAPA